jgi:amino acid adenylation domain-containing protein
MMDVKTASLVESVRRTAAAVPDRAAVVAGASRYSYDELDADSDALGRRLQEQGVGAGDVVAFSVARSQHAVVVMVACAKVRAAYLPLDPSLPTARRDFILDDARPRLLVTDETYQGAEDPPVPSISIGVAVQLGRPSRAPLPTDPEAADLAYLLYTSGSTGNPKGVQVTHGNIAALLEGTRSLPAEPSDVWLCAHNFAFDFSVWEIWGALVRGATVVIADDDDVRDPSRLLQLIEQTGVTVLSQTPGAFYRLAEPLVASLASGRSRVRTVVFGGEALSWRRLHALVGHAAPAELRLINMYGITEGTVHVTARSVAAGDLASVDEHSVGTPLPHMHCSVLGPHGDPVGPGEPGELVIAGPGVARGYVRDEVSEPRFFQETGTGLHSFRTGDIVSWSPTGELLYHHRKDRQVQVRGHRVECGEVEHRLLADSRLSAAVVQLVDEELVAFVVGDVTAESRSSVLSNLRSHLPEYMVPTRVVHVRDIPLTANGKVDREALVTEMPRHPPTTSSHSSSLSDRRGDAVPVADGELVSSVRQLWTVVLGHDDFDDDENFFEVGGHSFTAVALRELLHAQGHHVAVSDLFRHPTVASLATHLLTPAASTAADEVTDDTWARNSPRHWRATAAFQRARPTRHPTTRSATT